MLIGRWIVRYAVGSQERVADRFEGRPFTGRSARELARTLEALGFKAQAVYVP